MIRKSVEIDLGGYSTVLTVKQAIAWILASAVGAVGITITQILMPLPGGTGAALAHRQLLEREPMASKATEAAIASWVNQPSKTQQPALRISQAARTEFPLPNSVRNFQTLQGPGEAAINFQTGLSLNQAIAFYRQQFSQLGLTERTVNTAITDDTFSLIFDTWDSGKPVVVQGVGMGSSTNINIRLDDL